jgi:hypothetical protein
MYDSRSDAPVYDRFTRPWRSQTRDLTWRANKRTPAPEVESEDFVPEWMRPKAPGEIGEIRLAPTQRALKAKPNMRASMLAPRSVNVEHYARLAQEARRERDMRDLGFGARYSTTIR